jgi:hypothetical protein
MPWRIVSAWMNGLASLPFFRIHFRPTAVREDKLSLDGESATHKALIDLSIEGWRFARRFGRLLDKLDAGDAARYRNQQHYFEKKIEEGLTQFGLRLVNLEGQTYEAIEREGMAANALNDREFGPDETLVVQEMVEPVVMGPDGTVRRGTVVLAKVDPQ